ncbi:reverse transcriptase domain, reverse transcriptase zinc-binding domain protein [Tanacetum coccineum]
MAILKVDGTRVHDSDEFTYHHHCSNLNIINLCFADDLFLFAHGDVDSARVIMEGLDEFKNTSGLVPSLPKSTAYFCNVLNHVKLAILNVLPFEVENRIRDWKNKSLSFAGRLQHVQSVLSSMRVYWASLFILPSRIIFDIEQCMRGFFWCQGEMCKGKAKFDHIRPWKHESDLRTITYAQYPYCPFTTYDILVWRDSNGTEKRFSVATVWDLIRPRSDEVNWASVVWFSHCIPSHAFHLWLVIKRKLKTQDALRQWDVGGNTNLNVFQCPFYESQPDSHDHLFSECVFSSHIWAHMKVLADMHNVPPYLDLIVDWLIPFASKSSVRSVIPKFVLVASTYFISQERNFRLFKKKKRSREQLIEVITSTIRLKLLSFRFKKTRRVDKLLHN